MKDPKNLQKNMDNLSKIFFTIGGAAFLIKLLLTSSIKSDTFISDSLSLIFVVGFFSGGLALMISAISSSSGNEATESIFKSSARIVLKSILYVIFPAIIATTIMVIIFLR